MTRIARPLARRPAGQAQDRAGDAIIDGAGQPHATRAGRYALIAAALAFSIVVLDTTIVNVALPAIDGQLRSGLSGLQWIIDGYVVVFCALIVSGGTVADRLGASRCLAAGIAGFTIASIGCGLAPSTAVLLTARSVQGVAAALVLPASLALVRQAFPHPGERARAVAIWTAGGGAAVAAGPVFGGLLVAAFGWRAVFFVNLPVGIVCLAVLTRVPASRRQPGRFDLLGQALTVACVAGLAFAVIDAGRGGIGSPGAIVAFAVFLAALLALVVVERRVAEPMLPPDIFASPAINWLAATGLLLNLAYYGEVFVLSLFFQQGLGRSAAAAGLMFVPMTAMVAGVNLLAGRLVRLHGPRRPLLLGQFVFVLGLFGLLLIQPSSSTLLIEIPLIPLGIGAGLTIPPLTSAFLDGIGAQRAGIGSGVLNGARQLGSALGVAVFGALIGAGPLGGLHVTAIVGGACVLATTIPVVRYVHRRATADQ